MITIVVAVSKNGVIGKDNQLIWNIPKDLKRFKEITTGGVVVMGRKTHESIGRVLPNRLNVILSNNINWHNPLGDGCVVCYSIEEVLEKFKYRDLFIIGGGEIYKKFLPYTDFIEMTEVHSEFEGDTFFPSLEGYNFEEVSRESNYVGDYNYDFVKFQKK